MEFIASEEPFEQLKITSSPHAPASIQTAHMPTCTNAYHNPFEYNDSISAYHGVHGKRFNFKHHPIAPLGWMQSINLGLTRQSGILVESRHRSNIYRVHLGSLQSFQRLDSY